MRIVRPNLGVFSKFSKYSFFVASLLKKLATWCGSVFRPGIFGRTFRVRHPIFCLKKDRLCLIRWCVKFQQPILTFNLSHLKKIIFNPSEGVGGAKQICAIYSSHFPPGHPAYTVVIFPWTSCIYNCYFPKPPCIYSSYFPLTPCICSCFFSPGHPVYTVVIFPRTPCMHIELLLII